MAESWLICIEHLPCSLIFGVCLGCGGLNEEHFILVHRGSNLLYHAKRC